MTTSSKNVFPKYIPQGLIDQYFFYEHAIEARGHIGGYKPRAEILYKLFTTTNPSAIFDSLKNYNEAHKLDEEYFSISFEHMLHDALGLTTSSTWDLMKPRDKRLALSDIGKDITKLIGKLKRHGLDRAISDHLNEGLLSAMKIYEGNAWRPAKECVSLEVTSLCDVLESTRQTFESYDSSSFIKQPGHPNVKVHYFNRRFAEFMSCEYGEIDYVLIADVANIYFPDKVIDADTVRFQLRPLNPPTIDAFTNKENYNE